MIHLDCCVGGCSYTGKEVESSESAADAASSSHGDTDDVEYNFETVHNLDLYGCEMAPTVREGMRAWNMTVQYWLATYVYKRVPFRASSFRFLIFNLVLHLALWYSRGYLYVSRVVLYAWISWILCSYVLSVMCSVRILT